MYRIGKEEVKEVEKIINSKGLIRSVSKFRELDKFEIEWAKKIGTEHCICVNGGTSALVCGLVGLEIGPGDEVIVPGYTFMSSASAVLAVGAIPVIAEIDDSLTIDPKDIERKITGHTRAIMPVHMVGFPCDMARLISIAKKYRLKILEDCCQADGGSYKGKRLGSLGDAGAFSFNYFKILTSGEGGCLVTSNHKIYERALVYADSGATFRPYAKELKIPIFTGMQFRVSEITGAILRVQLKRLEGILSDLRKIKREFLKRLSGSPGIRFVRSNDINGDCGTTLAFSFKSEKEAITFATGVNGWRPIDSGKHVYSNWEPILKRRGSHHPALNPFNLPQNKGLRMKYTKDMCPKTLNILRRTVFILMDPDWSKKDINKRIEDCMKAGMRLK